MSPWEDAQWVFDAAEELDKLLFSTVEGIQEKQAELEKKLLMLSLLSSRHGRKWQ